MDDAEIRTKIISHLNESGREYSPKIINLLVKSAKRGLEPRVYGIVTDHDLTSAKMAEKLMAVLPAAGWSMSSIEWMRRGLIAIGAAEPKLRGSRMDASSSQTCPEFERLYTDPRYSRRYGEYLRHGARRGLCKGVFPIVSNNELTYGEMAEELRRQFPDGHWTEEEVHRARSGLLALGLIERKVHPRDVQGNLPLAPASSRRYYEPREIESYEQSKFTELQAEVACELAGHGDFRWYLYILDAEKVKKSGVENGDRINLAVHNAKDGVYESLERTIQRGRRIYVPAGLIQHLGAVRTDKVDILIAKSEGLERSLVSQPIEDAETHAAAAESKPLEERYSALPPAIGDAEIRTRMMDYLASEGRAYSCERTLNNYVASLANYAKRGLRKEVFPIVSDSNLTPAEMVKELRYRCPQELWSAREALRVRKSLSVLGLIKE